MFKKIFRRTSQDWKAEERGMKGKSFILITRLKTMRGKSKFYESDLDAWNGRKIRNNSKSYLILETAINFNERVGDPIP